MLSRFRVMVCASGPRLQGREGRWTRDVRNRGKRGASCCNQEGRLGGFGDGDRLRGFGGDSLEDPPRRRCDRRPDRRRLPYRRPRPWDGNGGPDGGGDRRGGGQSAAAGGDRERAGPWRPPSTRRPWASARG